VSYVVDRRLNQKRKSTVNRQRFIQRYRRQLKQAVSKAVSERSIKDMENGEEVNLPARDISEPTFGHGTGGKREIVHPGNKEFVTGDRIRRPQGGESGGSGGNQASNEGEETEDFAFQLSRDEFMDLFFDDLELPNLVKTQLGKEPTYKPVRAGYTTDGMPSNINVVRSMREAVARRAALQTPYQREFKELEKALLEVEARGEADSPEAKRLRREMEELEQRIRRVPFIDTFDLRYNNRVQQPQPTSQAVMFCVMDVSGSMDEVKKDLAKRFFVLLYLFLTRNYKRTEVVFVRHHTVASEVDEETFFYSRETGGTVVSSALRLVQEIIRDRYVTSDWNVYVAQASDGDNWPEDSPICQEVLLQELMPLVQYFAYVEISPERHQGLWYAYQEVAKRLDHFTMRQIYQAGDIYPVFRDLFKRQNAS